MNSETIEKTLQLIKEGQTVEKAITTATGLRSYDLEAPSKHLYPVQTPIRNSLPRVSGKGSEAARWKVVTSVGVPSSLFVAEGARNSEITYNEADKLAAYKTIGLDDSVTMEAEHQADNFEDLRATSTRTTMEQTMFLEESALLGASLTSLSMTPATPTMAQSTGGSIADATYKSYCVAIPFLGYSQLTLTAPLAVGATHSNKSAQGTVTVAAGGGTASITLTVAAIPGAVAYAWYVGANGAEKLEAVTTINSVKILALAGTGQAATAITTDTSFSALAFDGIIPQIITGGGLVTALPVGTLGTGTPLTYDGAGGIVEIDAMLQSLWDRGEIGPNELYVNSQQAKDINKKVMQASSQPIYNIQIPEGASAQGGVTAGVIVKTYLNKFTGQEIAIKIHPRLPNGTMVFMTRALPAWYRNSQVTSVWQVKCLRDYYEVEYAQTTRKWEHGVYAEEVLQCYVPQVNGILYNVAAG